MKSSYDACVGQIAQHIVQPMLPHGSRLYQMRERLLGGSVAGSKHAGLAIPIRAPEQLPICGSVAMPLFSSISCAFTARWILLELLRLVGCRVAYATEQAGC